MQILCIYNSYIFLRFASVENAVVIVIEPLKAISESNWSLVLFFYLSIDPILGQVAEQKVPACLLVEGGVFKTVDE